MTCWIVLGHAANRASGFHHVSEQIARFAAWPKGWVIPLDCTEHKDRGLTDPG
jgi:hypothetical protein